MKTLDEAIAACLEKGIRIGGVGQAPSSEAIWVTRVHKGSEYGIGQGFTPLESLEKALTYLERRVQRCVMPEGIDGPVISRATYDAAEKAMRGLTWEFDEWAYRSKTR